MHVSHKPQSMGHPDAPLGSIQHKLLQGPMILGVKPISYCRGLIQSVFRIQRQYHPSLHLMIQTISPFFPDIFAIRQSTRTLASVAEGAVYHARYPAWLPTLLRVPST